MIATETWRWAPASCQASLRIVSAGGHGSGASDADALREGEVAVEGQAGQQALPLGGP